MCETSASTVATAFHHCRPLHDVVVLSAQTPSSGGERLKAAVFVGYSYRKIFLTSNSIAYAPRSLIDIQKIDLKWHSIVSFL